MMSATVETLQAGDVLERVTWCGDVLRYRVESVEPRRVGYVTQDGGQGSFTPGLHLGMGDVLAGWRVIR
jgi:hypothetical protein